MVGLSGRWSLDHAIKGVCLLACTLALIGAAWMRGPWLDEFWSSWLSDPTTHIGRAFVERWMLDVHPPLFSFALYAIRHVVDFDMFGGRMVNLSIVAATFLLFLHIRARSAHTAVLDLFAVCALSMEMFVEQVLDFRSYTAVGCTVFLVLVCAFVLLESGGARSGRSDRGIWAIFAFATILGINLHYIAGMYVDFLCATLAGALLLTRRTRECCRILAILSVANAPVLAFVIAQRDYIITCITGGLWIETTAIDALVVTGVGMRRALLVPLALVALGFALNRFRWRPDRAAIDPGSPGNLRFAGMLAAAMVAFLIFIVALNSVVPLVQGRYLMPVFITAQFALLCLIPERIFRLQERDYVYAVALTAIVAWHAASFARQEQWTELTARVRQLTNDCPGSRVFTGVWWVISTPNEDRVFNFAYDSMSRRHGFRQEPIHVDVTPNPSAVCPDLFWFEHVDIGRESDGETFATKFKHRIPNYRDADVDVVVGKAGNSLLFVARNAAPSSDTACNSAVCAGQK